MFAELDDKKPSGLHYAAFVADDGLTFFHVAFFESSDGTPLFETEAFELFRKAVKAALHRGRKNLRQLAKTVDRDVPVQLVHRYARHAMADACIVEVSVPAD